MLWIFTSYPLGRLHRNVLRRKLNKAQKEPLQKTRCGELKWTKSWLFLSLHTKRSYIIASERSYVDSATGSVSFADTTNALYAGTPNQISKQNVSLQRSFKLSVTFINSIKTDRGFKVEIISIRDRDLLKPCSHQKSVLASFMPETFQYGCRLQKPINDFQTARSAADGPW